MSLCSSDAWSSSSQWGPLGRRLADGKLVVMFEPPQAQWNVPGARAVIKGAANLRDTEWPEVTEQNKASFRFFKVTVELP